MLLSLSFRWAVPLGYIEQSISFNLSFNNLLFIWQFVSEDFNVQALIIGAFKKLRRCALPWSVLTSGSRYFPEVMQSWRNTTNDSGLSALLLPLLLPNPETSRTTITTRNIHADSGVLWCSRLTEICPVLTNHLLNTSLPETVLASGIITLFLPQNHVLSSLNPQFTLCLQT